MHSHGEQQRGQVYAYVGEFVHEHMWRHVKCVKMPVVIFHLLEKFVCEFVCSSEHVYMSVRVFPHGLPNQCLFLHLLPFIFDYHAAVSQNPETVE